MQRVYILDRDKRFASRLGQVLGKQCPKYHFLSVGSPDEMKAFRETSGQDAKALIYTSSQFPSWHPDADLRLLQMREKPNLKDLYGNRLNEDLAGRILQDQEETYEEHEPADAKHRSVYRLAGATVIAEALEDLLEDQEQADQAIVLKTYLFHAPSPGQASDRAWERMLSAELDRGRRVIGLPLTPPHLFRAPALLRVEAPADRADLSSLFMRLEYDELAAADLLPYLTVSRQGCMAFAPVIGADDLHEVKPVVLRRLLALCQQALVESGEPSSLFVFTNNLSIGKLGTLLPLADEFVTWSDPNALDEEAWRTVLNSLLSALPAGRKHKELWEVQTDVQTI